MDTIKKNTENLMNTSKEVRLEVIAEKITYRDFFLLCWPVQGSALHGDRFVACCEAHRNFADKSVCLMAGTV
jgi:hypothetical protein